MSRAIWKFPFEVTDRLEVLFMPEGAEILSIQIQNSKVCIWAVCDERAPKVERRFHIYGTGHSLPENLRVSDHIGTIQVAGFVWHVFEVK